MHFSKIFSALCLGFFLIAIFFFYQRSTGGGETIHGLGKTHLETLKEIMPPASKIMTVHEVVSGDRLHHEVMTETPYGTMIAWIDDEGFPLKIIEMPPAHEVPATVLERLPTTNSPRKVERHWMRLYEIEIDSDMDGDLEVFVDGWGNERFRVPDSDDEEETIISWDDLPESVIGHLDRFMGDAPPRKVFREQLWGRTLYEVAWKSPIGFQEIKFFPTGEALIWELPPNPRLPNVVEALIQDELPEALFIAIYCLGEDEESCWLADGTPFPAGVLD